MIAGQVGYRTVIARSGRGPGDGCAALAGLIGNNQVSRATGERWRLEIGNGHCLCSDVRVAAGVTRGPSDHGYALGELDRGIIGNHYGAAVIARDRRAEGDIGRVTL